MQRSFIFLKIFFLLINFIELIFIYMYVDDFLNKYDKILNIWTANFCIGSFFIIWERKKQEIRIISKSCMSLNVFFLFFLINTRKGKKSFF